MDSIHASCIIPFYNEGNRIIRVIEAVRKSKFIKEIITVDDGSTDQTYILIRKLFPQIELIQLHHNIGKAGAVEKGIQKVKFKHVVLLDADLSQVDSSSIDQALDHHHNNNLDLIVFRMDHFYWTSKLFRHHILLSGNYIIHKNDLIQMYREFNPTGYLLEIAINQYMMNHHKKVNFVPFSAAGYPPIPKYGLWHVIKRDLNLYTNIIRFINPFNYLKQTFFFGTEGL